MSFLSPLTLIGLLLVALPVAIHLLVRRRARRLDFPSLKFLRETPSFKLHPRRIRQPLLLALRAAAIILLVLGLARPLLTFLMGKPAPVRFIMIDASLSMKARGRADAAREQARAIINKLAGGERAAVIALGSDATVLTEPTADQTKLLEAVDRYKPSSSAINYDSGFSEISSLLQREPQATGEIDIISDFQHTEAGTAIRSRAGLPVVTYPVGAQVERNAFSIDESVQQTDRGIELSVTEMVSEADGRSGARQTWIIDSKEGSRSAMDWRTESNGQITGRTNVLAPDDFDEDDERFFAFGPIRESRMLLIQDEERDGPYLQAALESASTGLPIDRQRVLPHSVAELSNYSMVVHTLHGTPRGDEAALFAEYARGGGTVLMLLSHDVDTESWNALAGEDDGRGLPFQRLERITNKLNLAATDTDAPQLRELDDAALAALSAVRLNTGYDISTKPDADILMRWNNGEPAFVSSRVGDGSILLLATSPARASGELGASASFPVLMSSIMQSAGKSRQPTSRVIGEAVRVVPPDADVKITNMRGPVFEAKGRDLVERPLAYFGDPGIYMLESEGRQTFLAFNSPAVESERTISTNEQVKRLFAAENVPDPAAVTNGWRETAERSGSTWRYFFIAAFLLMIAELVVASRRGSASIPSQ